MKMGEQMSNKEKSYNKIQWFFFVIFIPVVFTIILALVISSFLGFNVIEKGKELSARLPILSSYVGKEKNDESAIILELEQKLADQQAELDKKKNEIERKDKEISELKLKRTQVEEQQTVEHEQGTKKDQELKETAKTYEAMSPKNAAAIISELPNEEAIRHLTHVSIETRAKILAKMDSEKAADLISKLTGD